MAIQDSVNSALGTAAFLTTINPTAQEYRERKGTEALEKKHADIQARALKDKEGYEAALQDLEAKYEGKTQDEAYYKKKQEYEDLMKAMEQKHKVATERRQEAAAKLYDIDMEKYGERYANAFLSEKPESKREQEAESEAYLSRQRDKQEMFDSRKPPEEYDGERSSQANARAQRLLDTKAQLRADRLLPVGTVGRYGMSVDDFKPDANRYGADRIAAEFKRRNNEQK